ncbi:class I SAM-dependent methyltransferase [Pyruvatibacter sp.]|uniref:class I SAM-dependent methyltransferase n=1 Tax=Pyruvatibacter sp. TaxID=1981328 RepID=UPI0032EE35BE
MKQFYDEEYWELVEGFHEEDSLFKVKYASLLIDRNHLDPDSFVEIGCGAGRAARLMANKYGAESDAFDLAESVIEYARRNNSSPRVCFKVGSPVVGEKSYDVGYAFDVLEHVADYIGFLEECKRIAPVWIFHVPLDMNVSSVLRHGYLRAREKVRHIHYFSELSAIETLKDVGFTVEDKTLTPGWRELKGRQPFRGAIASAPRAILGLLNTSVAAHLLGGWSLMVLCRVHTPESSEG